jgi:cytochrome c
LSVSAGKRLIELSDCKSCHAVDKKSIGPSYKKVAKKYKGQFEIEGKLSDKIIKGGGGVWGEQVMAAHPQLSKEDVKEMIKYIFSLADDKKASKPVKGEYLTKDNGKAGTYIFSASYTDKGANNLGTMTGSSTLTLRSPNVKANAYDSQKETVKYSVNGLGEVVVAMADKSYIAFNQIDLTSINSFTVNAIASDDRTVGGKIELHLDSPNGQLIGSGEVTKSSSKPLKIAVNTANIGTRNLYFVFTNSDTKGKALFALVDINAEK